MEFNKETAIQFSKSNQDFKSLSKNATNTAKMVQNLTKVVNLEHETNSVFFEEIEIKRNQSLNDLATKIKGTNKFLSYTLELRIRYCLVFFKT